MKRLVGFVFFIVLSAYTSAQSPEDRILSAEMDYQLGRFEACRDSMEKLLTVEKSKSYRWQAYRLMALAELSLNQPEKALVSTLNMLRINPRYQPSSYKDSNNWTLLLRQTKPYPQLSLGLWLSPQTHFNQIVNVKSFPIEPGEDEITSSAGLAFGTELEFRPFSRLGFVTGINTQQLVWSSSLVPSTSSLREQHHTSWYLGAPILIKFWPKTVGKFQFFVEAGMGIQWSLSQTSSFYTYSNNEIQFELELQDAHSWRRKQLFSAIAGAGISREIGPGALSISFRWQEGLQLANLQEQRLRNRLLRDTFRYIEDDFRFRQFYFSIGYHFHLNYSVKRVNK